MHSPVVLIFVQALFMVTWSLLSINEFFPGCPERNDGMPNKISKSQEFVLFDEKKSC